MQEKGKPPHLFTSKIGNGIKKIKRIKKNKENQQQNKKSNQQTTRKPGARNFTSASSDQELFSTSARKLIYISVL